MAPTVHEDALAAAVVVAVVAGDVEVELPFADLEPQAASPTASETMGTISRILRIRSAIPESMDRAAALPDQSVQKPTGGRPKMPGGVKDLTVTVADPVIVADSISMVGRA